MKRVLACFAALGLLVSAGAASATEQADRSAGRDNRVIQPESHGQEGGHLPPKEENMELISRLDLASAPDEITDVDAHKGYAYVGTDYAACPVEHGGTGSGTGVHVINVKDAANPKKVAFVETNARNGEGIQAFHIKTPKFDGDVLLVSNETCDPTGTELHGGINIVNVTNPKSPKTLVSEFGDTDPNGVFGEEPYTEPNDVHSVFGWDAGDKAYAITTDNFEFGFLDIDIYNITDPRNPKLIYETGLLDEAWAAPISAQSANGDIYNHHDLWVRKIGGEWHAMISYWDLGWVLMNVNDPKAPTVVGDTDYPEPDALMPEFATPEGNAHQGTWSQDKQFWLGTDEDFAPYRIRTLSITTGTNAGDHDAVAVGGGAAPNSLPDGVMNGPTVYGGYGCPPDLYPGEPPVPQRSDYDFTLAEGEEAILVMQRGPSGDPDNPNQTACFPGEKAAEAIEAGWDAVLLVNRHLGDAESDVAYCGSGAYPPGAVIVTACTTHEAFHLMFNTTPSYEVPYDAAANDEPAIGAEGERISTTGDFDGWGYAHLYDAETLQHIDSYAPAETLDEAFATNFGTLSAHEVESDKRSDKHLAYFSWYAAGARTVSFGADGMEEVGAYIHPDGNDFWGVETIKRENKRPLLLFSDRHYGLYILKYTGPQ